MEKEERRFRNSLGVYFAATILFSLLVSPCVGQEDPAKFPSKTITMIVQWSPGGSADLTGRKLADLANKILGQQIVVENKAGGGGVIGGSALANAKPDGYTIGTATAGPLVYTPHMRSVPYNTKEDFTYIMQYAEGPQPFGVLADSPWKTFKEFIEGARRNPGKQTYATSGALSSQHIFMEQLLLQENVKVTHVPVGGASEAVTQLLGRHVDAAFCSEFLPHVKEGKVRPLVFESESRSKLFPDVPTFMELGYKMDPIVFYGLYAPKGLDPRILKKLNDAFKKAYEDPSFKEFLAIMYLDPLFKDSESFKTAVFKYFDSNAKTLKELGFAK